MGKIFDLAAVQQTVTITCNKEGNPQKVITKTSNYSLNQTYYYGVRWKEKGQKQQGKTQL